MAQETRKRSSTPALLVAFVVLLVTILGFGWNVILSAILAAVTFFVVVQLGGQKASADDVPAHTTPPHKVFPAEPELSTDTPEQTEPAAQPAAAPVEASAPSMAGQVKLGTLLPGEQDLANRRGGWRYEG
ncbi:MAG: hypothetical protein GJ677_12860 [Rhodobacteraceae bacterium]|nr:hypothetical protein [Paracoccaceae bacterium]